MTITKDPAIRQKITEHGDRIMEEARRSFTKALDEGTQEGVDKAKGIAKEFKLDLVFQLEEARSTSKQFMLRENHLRIDAYPKVLHIRKVMRGKAERAKKAVIDQYVHELEMQVLSHARRIEKEDPQGRLF